MKSVLIVEDDPATREVLSLIVCDLGMDYYSASTVKDSLEKLKKMTPSIILLDILLLDGDSKPIIKYCQDNLPNSKIVLLSALQQRQLNSFVEEFNIQHVLKKPFALDEIEAKLLEA